MRDSHAASVISGEHNSSSVHGELPQPEGDDDNKRARRTSIAASAKYPDQMGLRATDEVCTLPAA